MIFLFESRHWRGFTLEELDLRERGRNTKLGLGKMKQGAIDLRGLPESSLRDEVSPIL